MYVWKVCKKCRRVLNKEWHNPTGKEIIFMWEHPEKVEQVVCPKCSEEEK